MLTGIAGAPGVAVGKVVLVGSRRPGLRFRRIRPHLADAELERFDVAIRRAAEGLQRLTAGAGDRLRAAEASILQAYVLMVQDATLRSDVERRIRIDQQCTEWAVDGAITEMAAELRRSSNAYLSERSHDIEFVGGLLLKELLGGADQGIVEPLDGPRVLVAREVSPAELLGLNRAQVLGIVTELGTRTSHTAILARALELPAVVGVEGIVAAVASEDYVVVDGFRGVVTVDPTEAMIGRATQRMARHVELSRELHAVKDRPCATRCGQVVTLRANIEVPEEARIALGEGASGIGLYRTEFVYLDRTTPPSEDEQYEVYRGVVEAVSPLPVTLRTFDLGGDKLASAVAAPSQLNPALGLRAVRLALSRPDLFRAQLRAMVRASAHGPVRIMVPMISTVGELAQVRSLLAGAVADIDAAGQPRATQIPLGIMVEVPAAAVMSAELAETAEFLSIGTNDLVQYALAVDRSSRELAWLASPFDPAILRMISMVIEAGAARERSVSVCGAMASDPLAAALLIGMGVREFSLEASAIVGVKEAVGRVSLAEVEDLAGAVRRLSSAPQVEHLVKERLAARFVDILEGE